MKAKECMFAWNPDSSQVEIGPWPDKTRWSDKYDMTGGATYSHVREKEGAELVGYMFIEAMHLIIRDNVDPIAVHNAFCLIDEYRQGLAQDVPLPKNITL